MSTTTAAPPGRDSASDATKGLLIVLVAVGHCIPAQQVWPWLGHGGLYDFHVIAFLLLPFLRPPVAASIRVFADRAVRYLVPFVAFALLAWVAWHAVPHRPVAWTALPLALLQGDVASLSEGVGFTFLWFMPCLLSLTVLRSAIAATSKPLRGATVAVLIVLHGCLAGTNLRLPLNPLPAVYVLPLGLAVAALAHHRRARFVWLAVACSCGVIAAFRQDHINVASLIVPLWRTPLSVVLHDVYAIAATLTVVHFGPELARVPGLAHIGRYSLVVYLSHQFVLKAIEIWSERQPWDGTWNAKALVAVVAIPASLAAGWWLARILDRPRVRPWIRPHSVRDWPPTAWLVAATAH